MMVDTIPAGVMIPEHNTGSAKLLDADDTSGRDDGPFPKRGWEGTIRCGQGRFVCNLVGRHGPGIHNCGGRRSVANGRARQGDNPNLTWKITLKIMLTLNQF